MKPQKTYFTMVLILLSAFDVRNGQSYINKVYFESSCSFVLTFFNIAQTKACSLHAAILHALSIGACEQCLKCVGLCSFSQNLTCFVIY